MGAADTSATSPLAAVSVILVVFASSFIPTIITLLPVHLLLVPRSSRQMLYTHQNTSLYEQEIDLLNTIQAGHLSQCFRE
jgi:hypothetical protein